jgi:hypothetical protein
MAGAAEAGHVHLSGGAHFGGSHWGGGVHFSGGASVHWSSPGYAYRPGRWWGGGHAYYGWRGYYPWYPSYYYFYPEYVPSYYGTSYYPVAPSYAGPTVAAAYLPPPPLPRFGIGGFIGGVDSDLNQSTNTKETDFGLLARLRLGDGGLLVEGELGKTSYNVNNVDNVRVDRRMGGSLIYEFGAHNAFAPYVLGGLGVQQSDVGGDYKTTQDYGEVGVGLRLAVSRNIHITLDVRGGSRSTVSNDTPPSTPVTTTAKMVAPPSTSDNRNEDYTRVRLAAILYF